MARKQFIMGGGFSAGQVDALVGTVNSSVSSAGSSISDATALTSDLNVLSTVTTTQGVQLPAMAPGDEIIVYNDTVTECLVYPPSSSYQINQISAGSAHIFPGYTACKYLCVTTTQIVAFQSS